MDIDRIEMIAGHPALDFVNTVEGRGTDETVNYISDYARLIAWCRRAGLLSDDTGRQLLRRSSEHPKTAAQAWRRAMSLREALNTLFRATSRGDALPDDALSQLNEVAADAVRQRRLGPSENGKVVWQWRETSDGLEAPSWRLALAAADLLTAGEEAARIKVCANGPCDWLFLDTSRNGRRRWCRMHVCGNASKVRRFRERQKEG